MSVVPDSYTVSFDLDDDLDFSEVAGKVTASVESYKFFQGSKVLDEHYANQMIAEITLNDLTDTYTPESASSFGLEVGQWAQFSAVYGSVTFVLFTGQILKVRSQVFTREVMVTLVGRLYHDDVEIDVPFFQSETTGDIVTSLLDDWFFRTALNDGTNDYLVLDQGRLDNEVLFSSVLENVDVDIGQVQLDYFGDEYASSPTLGRVLQDLTAIEYGWLYENKHGDIVFEDRKSVQSRHTVDYTISESSIINAFCEYGINLQNDARTSLVVRETIEDYTLWENPADIEINALKTLSRVFRFKYTDGSILGVRGDLEYVSWDFQFDWGATAQITTKIEMLGNGVKVEFVNNNNFPVFFKSGAQIKGTALIKKEPQDLRAINAYSQTYYGQQMTRIPFPAVSNVGQVQDVLDWFVATRSIPRNYITAIDIHNASATELVYMLNLNIGDVVNLDFSRVNHSDEYLIIGKELMNVGSQITSRFYLSPRLDTPLLLDVSGHNVLDTDVLGF